MVRGTIPTFLQVIFKRKGWAYDRYQFRVSFLRSYKFFSRGMAELKFGTSCNGTVPTFLQYIFERNGWAYDQYQFRVSFLRSYKFFFERHGWAKVRYEFWVSFLRFYRRFRKGYIEFFCFLVPFQWLGVRFLRFYKSFSRGKAEHTIGTSSGYRSYVPTSFFREAWLS